MGQGLYTPDMGIRIGAPTRLSYNGRPDWIAGGISIDWSTVAAVSGADVTLPDGEKIPIGQKYLRYGQVMAMIGTAPVHTFTLTGGPTAGSAIFQYPAVGATPAETLTIGFGDAAATVQAAMRAMARFGVKVTVARTGAGSAADPYVFTATFDRSVYAPTPVLLSHTFTGGTTPTGTPGVTTASPASNATWGPYDPSASDGRQTTAAAGVPLCILDTTQRESLVGGLTGLATNFASGIVGGKVYLSRLIAGLGSASLANGPTLAQLLAALPKIEVVAGS